MLGRFLASRYSASAAQRRIAAKRAANRVEIEPALLANTSELQALGLHVQELRRRIAQYEPGRSTMTIAAQHSLIVSSFPDFAALARRRLPMVTFRVRAANQNDCISLFLSGEASLLMCYEREGEREMPFDSSVIRSVWGRDRLVQVVGGPMRFALRPDGQPPDDAPLIRYPPSSFFGKLLDRGDTAGQLRTGQVCVESAFTSGIKEMALAGLGVGWLPMGLVHSEVQSGALIVCNSVAGTILLRITLYARPSDETAVQLCGLR